MSNMFLLDAAVSKHQSNAVTMVDRYWHQLATGGIVPKRQDVDPSRIQDALEFTFVAEQLSGGHARLRVAGGSIAGVLGMEVAGMPLAVLVNPAQRADFARLVARVFDGPAKTIINMKACRGSCGPDLTATLRLYPLLDMSGRPRQLLGTFVTNGAIGAPPRRFDISSENAVDVRHASTPRFTALRTFGHLSLVASK